MFISLFRTLTVTMATKFPFPKRAKHKTERMNPFYEPKRAKLQTETDLKYVLAEEKKKSNYNRC